MLLTLKKFLLKSRCNVSKIQLFANDISNHKKFSRDFLRSPLTVSISSAFFIKKIPVTHFQHTFVAPIEPIKKSLARA